jgi:hypothetical protein
LTRLQRYTLHKTIIGGSMKDLRTTVITALGVLVVSAAILAAGQKSAYKLEAGTGIYKSGSGNFEMTGTFDKARQTHVFTVTTRTRGWAAIGFGSTLFMKNAEMLMVYEKDGKGIFEHQYGTGFISHKAIGAIDASVKESPVKLISFKENENGVSFTLERPANISGKYYKELASGKQIRFIYALGKDTNIIKKHKERESGKIVLPN